MKFKAEKVETVATTVITDFNNPWKETKVQCW